MPAKKPAPKRATIEDLLGKAARTVEVPVGESTMLFSSIGLKRYDDLIADNPPTKEQEKEGATWNPDTFPQALVSACSVDPKLTLDQVKSIWESDAWSKGELMDVFLAVVKLNSDGLNIPFTGSA